MHQSFGSQPISVRLWLVVGVCVFIGWLLGVISLGTVLTVVPEELLTLEAEEETSGVSGGTGFVISPEGYVLTNAHVAGDCETVTARINGRDKKLYLLGTDYPNDLALLTLGSKWGHFATLRDRDVKLAEPVIVAGFPLQNDLSETIHITTGEVSNLAGYHGDTVSFQTTAPIQPGNSGSPVLDYRGKVIGIAASKLIPDDGEETPDNVGFAVKSSTIRTFLRAHSVEVETTAADGAHDAEKIAMAAKFYTLALKCEAGE